MKHDLSCLLCENFAPTAPRGWTPPYDGATYHHHDAREAIKKQGVHQPGACRLNPVHVAVTTGHVCEQIKLASHAVLSTSNFIWGSWQEREYKEAEARALELARKLKISREISRSRLRRLQKLEKRKVPQQKPTLVKVDDQ